MKTIIFFNNKGGVGKTFLTYHLAWMLADHGLKVIAVDFDPQANLTSMFLDEYKLEELWSMNGERLSILGAIQPILKGIGDVADPHIEEISDNIELLAGDLGLATFEEKLSEAWLKTLDTKEDALRVISVFYRVMLKAFEKTEADLVLIDVGPNLGAINRTALISSDYIVVPLGPDLYSLQGLRNLGPTLRDWRRDWKKRLEENKDIELPLPSGRIEPVGYVLLQHNIRMDRPIMAYDKWMARIPPEYRESVLGAEPENISRVEDDPHCIALIKHYRSLMPMAMEARKPIFFLKPADGAIGAYSNAVRSCYKDFKHLAQELGKRCGFELEY